MPSYKLIYFNVKGRAELIRFIFAAADVAFEDVRFTQLEWPSHKPNYPFGQLPALDVDGVHIGQSIAIAHFLAREFQLAGKTNIDDAHCLAFAEQIKDLLDAMGRFRFQEEDETRKAAMRKTFEEGALKNGLAIFESCLKGDASAPGYFVGDDFTWADLAVYSGIELLQLYLESGDLLTAYPKLAAHRSAINSMPRIKAYLERRPNTKL